MKKARDLRKREKARNLEKREKAHDLELFRCVVASAELVQGLHGVEEVVGDLSEFGAEILHLRQSFGGDDSSPAVQLQG